VDLARQVTNLKAIMAEHARDAIAEWTELEASSAPLPRHIPEESGAYDSALKRSNDRLPRAPRELPRRPPDPPPDFSGSLPSPTSP
jgi:hypothetical protein